MHSEAAPDQVWRLLEDAPRWPTFAGFSSASYEREGEPPPHGVGAIRSFGTGPIRSREEVVTFEPPHRFAYVLLSGLPVRGYRAEVTLTGDGSGTRIAWRSSWAGTPPGLGRAMHWFLRRVVGDLARRLAKAAESG